MISIFIPTRGRSASTLPRCLDSLISKAHSKENYEIIFGIDSDDESTLAYIESLDKNIFNFQSLVSEPLGYKFLYVLQNKMAEISRGDFFWLFADDVEVNTKDWDLEILKNTGKMYLNMSLGSNFDNWPYSLIPIISREWYSVTGRISCNSQTDCWLGCIAYDLQLITNTSVVCNLFMASDGTKHNTDDLSTISKEDHRIDKLKLKNYTNSNDIGEQIGFV